MDCFKKVITLEQAATDFGFKWETADQILNQVKSECDEIKVHLVDQDNEKLQMEIGDLLHAVISLCIFCRFDPQETLMKSTNKFERRFQLVKQLANEQGLDSLEGKSFSELMLLWDKAKELTK